MHKVQMHASAMIKIAYGFSVWTGDNPFFIKLT